MVITHGYIVRSFIQKKIPTLVISDYGFGGWITPKNINYFLKDNFRGRPGGKFGELIPSQIVIDELLEIQEEQNLENILIENALIINHYLQRFPSKQIDAVISSITELHKKFKAKNHRHLLRPKLASNVQVFNNVGKVIIIKRKVINDVLFTIAESERDFLNDLNGVFTCRELKNKYGMAENEFWEILNLLWERKAITFHYEI